MLAAYVAGGQAGEVPAVMEAMKVGARLPPSLSRVCAVALSV